MSTQSYYKDRLGFDPREEVDSGRNNVYYSSTNGGPPSKMAKQGYEESLTKFKGTTCWEFFINDKGGRKVCNEMCANMCWFSINHEARS